MSSGAECRNVSESLARAERPTRISSPPDDRNRRYGGAGGSAPGNATGDPVRGVRPRAATALPSAPSLESAASPLFERRQSRVRRGDAGGEFPFGLLPPAGPSEVVLGVHDRIARRIQRNPPFDSFEVPDDRHLVTARNCGLVHQQKLACLAQHLRSFAVIELSLECEEAFSSPLGSLQKSDLESRVLFPPRAAR